MNEAQKPSAGVIPVDGQVRPVAWRVQASYWTHMDSIPGALLPPLAIPEPLYDQAALDHERNNADMSRQRIGDLRAALTEIRDRIKGRPAYADLTMDEEIEIGGDTAELSYLARVADGALGA
jgi:hypothetical protein